MTYKPLVERIGISLCACGLCCNKSYPCEKCLENTLKSNGVSVDDIDKFRGLSQKPADYSELGNAMRRYLLERCMI